jgi:hypothetical protein
MSQRLERITWEETMIRLLITVAALAVATSAEAMSPAPLHQADGVITQVRQACGLGQVRINGICMYRSTARQVRRGSRKCVAWSEGVCSQHE